MTAANASGRIKKYQFVVGSILLLIVPISYIVLKFGSSPEAVLWTYLIVIFIAQGVRLLLVRGLVHLSIRSFFLLVLSPVFKVTFISFWFPFTCYHYMKDNVMGVLTVIVASVISILFTIYCIGINKSERGFLNSKLRNFYKRIST